MRNTSKITTFFNYYSLYTENKTQNNEVLKEVNVKIKKDGKIRAVNLS